MKFDGIHTLQWRDAVPLSLTWSLSSVQVIQAMINCLAYQNQKG